MSDLLFYKLIIIWTEGRVFKAQGGNVGNKSLAETVYSIWKMRCKVYKGGVLKGIRSLTKTQP